jgi:RNA polymerase sigma factor for flagellar operon FliA
MELYYHSELNMKEVGQVLGVTESRVCQLHSQAASRLRTALRARMRPLNKPAAKRKVAGGSGRNR